MEKEKKEFKSFDDFTNLYEVQKTLRFELKAMPETDAVLRNKGIWYADDEKRAKEKLIVKFYMDILHREFTKEALQRVALDLGKFFELFGKLKQAHNQAASTKEDKKLKQDNIRNKRSEVKGELEKLAERFRDIFDQTDQNWKIKYREAGKTIKNEKSGCYLILSANVLSYLKNRFTQDEIKKLRTQDKKRDEEYKDIINSEGENIVDNFKGFFGYFDSLINNRKNFYKIDGKASRISTRALNENLNFFAENLYIFQTHFKNDLLQELTENEKEIFQSDFYNTCLLQNGITIYNLIVGDVNKKINKYNQQKDTDIPFLKILYKQILSLEDKEDYKHIEIRNDNDLIYAVKDFMEVNASKIAVGKEIFSNFITRCRSKNNLDQIYLPKDSMNTIARKIFKSWEDVMALYKGKYLVSLQEFSELMESKEWQRMAEESKEKDKHLIFKEFVVRDVFLDSRDTFANFLLILEKEYQNKFTGFEREVRGKKIKFIGYNEGLENLQMKLKWFEDKKSKKEKLNDDDEKADWIKAIKEYADAALRVFQMTKYLWLPIIGDEDDKDYRKIKAEAEGLTKKNQDFYNKIDSYIIGYEPYVYHSSFQEYLTRKPFSEDKFKINFDNSQLLKGWDQNQEINKCSVILRKDDVYYLGIINPKFRNDLFRKPAGKSTTQKIEEAYRLTNGEDRYAKMEYKAVADASKDVQGLLLSRATEENLKKFNPSNQILRIKEEESYKKGENFNLTDLHTYIDYFKTVIPEYGNWDHYKFDFSDTKIYQSFDEFTDEVDYYGYKVWFEDVSSIYIKKKLEEGALFLFKIKIRDFSKKSSGRPNLHTSYFQYLFSNKNDPGENNGRVRYRLRLCGNAEIFYRRASVKDKEQITTNKNKITITKKVGLYHLKRYTEDKIFLHLPIRLNADSHKTKRLNVNQSILKFLKKQEDLQVIGIDRGEKNLAYYSIVSQTPDGKVKVEDCGDLNLGYLEPLDKLEKDRQEQRKAWQSIAEIKNKRNGYISHAIHKIADLILEHKAIVVFEDLSGSFKRSRMKIEKAPYQQLELALINKLNYLVSKNTQEGKPGHYLSAYQLTKPIGSYKDIGKQTGMIFYTQAGYTSRTCPLCGWRKRIQGLRYKNLDTAKKFFDPKKGIQVSFDGKCFIFSYLVMYEGKTTKDWDREIYSDVSRVRWNSKERNYTSYETNEITKKLQGLLEQEYKVNIKGNINAQIQNIQKRDFWECLINLLLLILEIRNTDNESGRDYIECPHCHFHSGKKFQGHEWNGDANGAFNIARKGLMILERIQASNEPEKITWGDLSITIKEWDITTAKWAKGN